MKEAQRSIGVFYRYYKSKDELLLELTEEFRQKLLREIHLPLRPNQIQSKTLKKSSASSGSSIWKSGRS